MEIPNFQTKISAILMGGATDFKVAVENRIRERSERKKIFLYPHFCKCGGTSKQISVWAGGFVAACQCHWLMKNTA